MDVFRATPTEIVATIFSYLSSADLLQVSYLSHRLRAISQPILYSSPALYTGQRRAIDRETSPLEKFLLTILSPPCDALATRVTSLHLLWGCGAGSESNHILNNQGLLEPPPSLQVLRRLQPKNKVQLLLSRLPRLRALHVSLDHISTTTLDSFIAEFTTTLGTAPSPSAFHSLREFWYTHGGSCNGINPSSLLALLQLPSIDLLDISLRLAGFPPDWGIGCTSTVTKLSLWNTGIMADELDAILKVPRRLTHFSTHAPIDAPFARALAPLRGSLRHLSLMTDACLGTKPQLVGSLRAWSHLTSLRCALGHVLDTQDEKDERHLADALPLGLCTLEILHDWHAVGCAPVLVSQTVKMLEVKDDVGLALQRLAVDMDDGEARAKVQRACVAAGVSFCSPANGVGAGA